MLKNNKLEAVAPQISPQSTAEVLWHGFFSSEMKCYTKVITVEIGIMESGDNVFALAIGTGYCKGR